MKKYVVLATLLLINISIFGQIKNIQTKDSTVVVDNVYAGMLSSTAFNVDKLKTAPSVNFRLGARATWMVNKVLSFRSLGMLEVDLNQTSGLQLFFAEIKPNTKWKISVGHMATPSTEQRALPVTAGGQFETWTQARIPGAAAGVKVSHTHSKDLSFGIGIANRANKGEYHANVVWKKSALSIYHRTNGGQTGMAFSYDGEKVYDIVVFIPDSLIATTFVYNFSKDISLFTDIGYYPNQKSFPRGELGVFKSFSSKWVNGLVSLSYDMKLKSVVGYLFIHL